MLLKEEEKEERIKRQRKGGSALPSLSWLWLGEKLERVERKLREKEKERRTKRKRRRRSKEKDFSKVRISNFDFVFYKHQVFFGLL